MICTLCGREIAADEPFVDEDGILCTQCVMATWTDALETGVPAPVIRYVLRHQPFTRAHCAGLPKPCPLESCRFNWRDNAGWKHGNRKTGGLKPWTGCALDAMDEEPGRWTLDAIGERMGLTRERVRQIESKGLRHVRRGCEAVGFSFEDFAMAVQEEGPSQHDRLRAKRLRHYHRQRRKAMKESA